MPGTLGAFGEAWAVGFLTRQGFTIVDRNVRFRGGELDVVAYDGGQLVFVEVKCRRSSAFGSPEESISARRYALFERAALHYMEREKITDRDVRLDVVALVVGHDGTVVRCNHLRGVESPAR